MHQADKASIQRSYIVNIVTHIFGSSNLLEQLRIATNLFVVVLVIECIHNVVFYFIRMDENSVHVVVWRFFFVLRSVCFLKTLQHGLVFNEVRVVVGQSLILRSIVHGLFAVSFDSYLAFTTWQIAFLHSGCSGICPLKRLKTQVFVQPCYFVLKIDRFFGRVCTILFALQQSLIVFFELLRWRRTCFKWMPR